MAISAKRVVVATAELNAALDTLIKDSCGDDNDLFGFLRSHIDYATRNKCNMCEGGSFIDAVYYVDSAKWVNVNFNAILDSGKIDRAVCLRARASLNRGFGFEACQAIQWRLIDERCRQLFAAMVTEKSIEKV